MATNHIFRKSKKEQIILCISVCKSIKSYVIVNNANSELKDLISGVYDYSYENEKQRRITNLLVILKTRIRCYDKKKLKSSGIPWICSVCKKDTSIHLHHDNYGFDRKPILLCQKHHYKEHKKLRSKK